ncbi:hypothetical protein NP199_25065, partial [Salmonella enterica]|nr:hypothetical protein [Salmonella enterica]
MKLLLIMRPYQEIITNFFLLPLDDHEAMLRIEWLMILGDVSWNFMKLIMKFYSKGKQVILNGKCGGDITTICTQQMEKILHKVCSEFLVQLEQQTKGEPTKFEDPNLLPLLAEFLDIFDEPHNLPLTRRHDHCITILPGKSQANAQPYQYSHLQKDEIERIVNEMLKTGVIRPCCSPYSSPVLLIRKKDRIWRLCVDYRALNGITIKDKYPILVVDELLREHKSSQSWTFDPGIIKYEYAKKTYRKPPFEHTITTMNFCFLQKKVEYLGHIISEEGVAVDPFKIGAMQNWLTPRNIKLLHGFLGLTGYYCKFVKNYGEISAPLTSLLKKDVFQWSDRASVAFDKLKAAITTMPVLT